MQERGVSVAHSTVNRWVIKYSPLLAFVDLIDWSYRVIADQAF